MLEVALHFEKAASRFDPAVMIGPGIACLIIGLFIWLGGLGFRRLLVAIVGAVGGAICGFFVIGHNVVFAVVLAAVFAIVATIFERIFITILAAALAMVLSFAVMAVLPTDGANSLKKYPEYKVSTEPLSMQRTIETAQAYMKDFSGEIRQSCSYMHPSCWAIMAGLAVIFILGGFWVWRLTSALCCAALGTMLVFVGMIILLMYKGAEPINHISHKAMFYVTVFGVMTAFGTVEQLVLCPHLNKKFAKKEVKTKDKNKDKQESETKVSNWRTG